MFNGYSFIIFFLSLMNSLSLLYFSLTNIEQFPSDIGETNWSLILSYIEVGVGASTILIATAVFGIEIGNTHIKEKRPLKISTILFSVIFLICIVLSGYRMSEMGLFLNSGICKRTTGDLVCPTVLYRSEYDIEDVRDCTFNAFAESPGAWLKTGIDWSDKSVYTNKELLFEAYKVGRPDGDIKTVDDMLIYSDCYYWGCDPICNDRHDHNVFHAWSLLISSIVCFVIVVITVFQTDNSYVRVLQTEKSEEEEPEELEEPEEIEIPDAESEEEAEEEDDKSDSFSGSNSWNFRLRM